MTVARWLTLCSVLPLAVGACHSRTSAPAGEGSLTAANVPAGPAAAQAERMPRCPNVVPGASTIVAEVPDGIELRIVAEGNGQNEIRQRATALASAADDTRGKHQANGAVNARFGRCPVVMRNTKVETREIPGGVAIVVKPSNASELEWLRREVASRAAQLPSPRSFGPGLLKACPNATPNAVTTVMDKPYGADMRITAGTAEDVRAIRERARQLATPAAPKDDRCPAAVSDASLTVTEIPEGVVISMRAKRPDQAPTVRHVARERWKAFMPPQTR